MDFDGFIEKLLRMLVAMEERNIERYKHLAFKEHFDAGIEYRDRQYRSEVRTALISIVVTVILMGSGFLIANGGVQHLQHLLGGVGGEVHG